MVVVLVGVKRHTSEFAGSSVCMCVAMYVTYVLIRLHNRNIVTLHARHILAIPGISRQLHFT